jgi:Xaa-Pro aminopeptidase
MHQMFKYHDSQKGRKRKSIDGLARQIGCDLIIGSSPEHFSFISSADFPGRMITRRAFACVDADAKAFVVMYVGDGAIIKEQSWIRDFVLYKEFAEEPIEVLVSELRNRGFAKAKIGLDLDSFSAASLERIKRSLPDAILINSYSGINKIRAIKEPDEIKSIESATKATHQAVVEAFASSRPGDTERQINSRILDGCFARGARTVLFSSFGSGESWTSEAGAPTSQRRLAWCRSPKAAASPSYISFLAPHSRLTC